MTDKIEKIIMEVFKCADYLEFPKAVVILEAFITEELKRQAREMIGDIRGVSCNAHFLKSPCYDEGDLRILGNALAIYADHLHQKYLNQSDEQ